VDVARITRGDTSLTWACQYSDAAMVQFLLDSGGSANEFVQGGWSCLHYATQLGNEALVRVLIAHGAKADVAAQNGRTPLIDAAERGYMQIALLLLDAGADAHRIDSMGMSAAVYAIDLCGGDVELAGRFGWNEKIGKRMCVLGRRPSVVERLCR